MLDLNQMWVDFQCPQCNYLDEVQMVDIKSEKTIFCHNCKVSIRLVDGEASTYSGIEKINRAFNDLEKTFKKFGK